MNMGVFVISIMAFFMLRNKHQINGIWLLLLFLSVLFPVGISFLNILMNIEDVKELFEFRFDDVVVEAAVIQSKKKNRYLAGIFRPARAVSKYHKGKVKKHIIPKEFLIPPKNCMAELQPGDHVTILYAKTKMLAFDGHDTWRTRKIRPTYALYVLIANDPPIRDFLQHVPGAVLRKLLLSIIIATQIINIFLCWIFYMVLQ